MDFEQFSHHFWTFSIFGLFEPNIVFFVKLLVSQNSVVTQIFQKLLITSTIIGFEKF